MATYNFVRLLRTASSERFVVQREGEDIGACDLHFTSDRRVLGSLFVMTSADIGNPEIENIVAQIDEHLLPDVHRDDSDFVFTVMRGDVIGAYSPVKSK